MKYLLPHNFIYFAGVLSALRHDTIVGDGNPDYALVENEAERVAKEAVIFLCIFQIEFIVNEF